MSWTNKYIKPNKFSRPQKKLTTVRKIVIHWTANFGAGANNHFNYFNNLKDRYASAHLFIDKSEALCIIPLDEIAYHCNDGSYRGVSELKPNGNFLSIGVEMCVEKDGSFHPDTITRTVDVVAELCRIYNLDPVNDIVTHHMITRKNCPAPWITKPQEFINFKANVKAKNSSPSPTLPSGNPLLKSGLKGVAVERLQTKLNEFGYNIKVDGDFGNGTLIAVKDFQSKNNLVVDGIVGESTWDKLYEIKQATDPDKSIISEVLPVIVPKDPKFEEVMEMKLSNYVNDYNMHQVEMILKEAKEDGFLTDDRWREKAADKAITLGEYLFVDSVINHRKYKKVVEDLKEIKAK